MISDREQKCGTWWRGKTADERFLLYYTCLRFHYRMPASEALATAKRNWPQFGQDGDLIATIKAAINLKG